MGAIYFDQRAKAYETCGTCKYRTQKKGVNYCENTESEYYASNVDYDDGCEKYEEGER